MYYILAAMMLAVKQLKTTTDAVVLFMATSLGFPNSFLFTVNCISLLFSSSKMQKRLNYLFLNYLFILIVYLHVWLCGACVCECPQKQQHWATRSWT